ncbi:hypothetical protein PM038_00140 [Halorubrum ezzemoulense]|uniref:hypothetical protein n=1 Tax=Halorubrum ezzemoulense TaxID=337243 RepID=UPI00232AB21C|nr:hypothetical protein [Halorubrum ezzemoulense]MDB2283684.1 hypothetical protein [Halorubrum ezzemoulense]
MSRLRNFAADCLEEAARGRRASSRSSAALGRILRHLGAAKAFERIAECLRVDGQKENTEGSQ